MKKKLIRIIFRCLHVLINISVYYIYNNICGDKEKLINDNKTYLLFAVFVFTKLKRRNQKAIQSI